LIEWSIFEDGKTFHIIGSDPDFQGTPEVFESHGGSAPGWAVLRGRRIIKKRRGSIKKNLRKNHGCKHLNHPGRLYSVEIFSPPVLSRSEKIRG
jgi:hypothetical protein